MEILDIPASELNVGDVLGEGMQIWLIVSELDASSTKLSVTIRWGERTSSFFNPSPRKNTINYKPTDIVRVIRSDNERGERTD